MGNLISRGLTGVYGSIRAMPFGALPTSKPASAGSSAAAAAALATFWFSSAKPMFW